MPADVVAEVKAKQQQDDQQIASLASRVTLAPIKTGRDGGMHPTFLAKLKPQEVREPDGTRALRGRRERRQEARLLRQSADRDLSGRHRHDGYRERKRSGSARRAEGQVGWRIHDGIG